MKVSLGFSPCPNDTFIFDALVNGKIDTQGFEFDVILADVEELNKKSFRNELDFTKLSYHAFAFLTSEYNLLDAGSALGNNCGPLLVATKEWDKEALQDAKIAIPGKFTTANFLLKYYSPEIKEKHEVLFSNIENIVLSGKMDAGVIIHENRFTYADRGLVKLVDLGTHWERETKFPIPLGGIAANKRIDEDVQVKFNALLKKSIQYAFENNHKLSTYVTSHAQEMEHSVIQKHINLYVNDFSKQLGFTGEAAIKKMFETIGVGSDLKIIH